MAAAASTQAVMESTSRMKPRTMASRPETSMTTISTISSSVIGIGYPVRPRDVPATFRAAV